jgi:hypothetical protein
MPPAEREGGDRARRVRADALQREQIVELGRDLPAMTLDHLDGRTMQPERASRIAEPIPGPHRLGGRLGRERGRRRPPPDPCLPPGRDACDLRLLQHEFTHEHGPRGDVGGPPGQRPSGVREPRVQRVGEVGIGRSRHPIKTMSGRTLRV